MKLVTYSYREQELVGFLTPDEGFVCPLTAFGYPCGDMVQAIGTLRNPVK